MFYFDRFRPLNRALCRRQDRDDIEPLERLRDRPH